MQSLNSLVARERVADRLERAHEHQRLTRTGHPPSRVRRRAATAAARLAWRLDRDAARLAVR